MSDLGPNYDYDGAARRYAETFNNATAGGANMGGPQHARVAGEAFRAANNPSASQAQPTTASWQQRPTSSPTSSEAEAAYEALLLRTIRVPGPPSIGASFMLSLVLVLLLTIQLSPLLTYLAAPASIALIVWFGWPAFAGASIAYLISEGAAHGIAGLPTTGGTIIAFAALAAAFQRLKPVNPGMVFRLILVAVLVRFGLNLAFAVERGLRLTIGLSVVNAAITLVIAAALVWLLTPWLKRRRWVASPAPALAAPVDQPSVEM